MSTGRMERTGATLALRFVEESSENDKLRIQVEPEGGSDQPTSEPIAVVPLG